MLKAILYKEWIKSRWYLAVAFAVTCAFAGYAMLRLYRALGMMGAGHIWEVMVTRNAVFVEQMEYVPLLAGLLLAVVQFAPEMHRKCLKLTLHLPVSALRATGTMLLFGVAALTVVSGTSLALVAGAASPVLPHELVANIVGTLMPWYAAGLAAYLFAAWVILEVEAPDGEYPDGRAPAAHLLPRARSAGLCRLPARTVGADTALGLARMALGRAVHGRQTRLIPSVNPENP